MNITIYPVLYNQQLAKFQHHIEQKSLNKWQHEIRTSQEDNFLRHQMF